MPSAPKLLALDSELLFSQRFCELAKRVWPTVQFRSTSPDGADQQPSFAAFRAEDVLASAQRHSSNVLLVSSEVLLYADGVAARRSLINELVGLSRNTSTTLMLAAFDAPLRVVTNPAGGTIVEDSPPPWYHDDLAHLKRELAPGNTLVFSCPPYFTHGESRIQANPARLLFSESQRPSGAGIQYRLQDSIVLADFVIEELLQALGKHGKPRHGTPAGGTAGERAGRRAIPRHTHLLSQPELVPGNVDRPFPRAVLEPLPATLHHQINCSLKLLYRKAPEEVLAEGSVADFRYALGRRLSASLPVEIVDGIDLVVPVPETGRWYAKGAADELGKPCVEAIVKKAEIGRSFDIQNHSVRREFLNEKLDIAPDLIADKSIAIVDEAIFSGATLRLISRLLRSTSVRAVYLLIASPECKSQCSFNMQPERDMLSEYVRDSDLAAYFDVNGVFFQEQHTYEAAMARAGYLCTRCFSDFNSR